MNTHLRYTLLFWLVSMLYFGAKGIGSAETSSNTPCKKKQDARALRLEGRHAEGAHCAVCAQLPTQQKADKRIWAVGR